MDIAKNIQDVVRMPDNSFLCKIELFDDWTDTWETVPYSARAGDKAPVNNWILSELATGNYVITDWVPPASIEVQAVTTGSGGPNVVA